MHGPQTQLVADPVVARPGELASTVHLGPDRRATLTTLTMHMLTQLCPAYATIPATDVQLHIMELEHDVFDATKISP